MSSEIPLGRCEDLHLEFKSMEALERPEIIVREVAAMLNAEGGEVWIGLRDESGAAVEIQQVPDPEPTVDRLRDSLVDRLEPSPLPGEVQIAPVPHSAGAHVLRIVVAPAGARRPYAFLKSGGRQFLVRIGNRIRNMSREEIRDLFERSSDSEQSVAKTIERVLNERQAFQKTAGERMWLRILPAGDMNLDLQSLRLRDLLENPSKTGNRDAGWHFAQTSSEIRIAIDKRSWSYGLFKAELAADGGLEFSSPLNGLRWKTPERVFNPWPLLEYPISAFRLASKIYDPDLTTQPKIASDLALFGLRGWKLRRGSPGTYWVIKKLVEYPDGNEDLVCSRPLVFTYKEVLDEPDRCGYRLVRRIYEAFGYEEPDMPREFDLEAGRLVLPE